MKIKKFLQVVALVIMCVILMAIGATGAIMFCAENSVPQTRILNDWYMLKDGEVTLYKKGYFEFSVFERDSIRLNAVQNLGR